MADRPAPRAPRRLRRGERWTLDLLHRHGRAVPDPDGNGSVHSFELDEDLGRHLERDRLRVTFQRRLAARDGIELGVPGSWLFDQLLRFATGRGRIGVFYLPRGDADPGRLAERRRLGGDLTALEERRYGPLVQFHFRLFFYSDPPREEIQVVLFDVEQGKVLRRGIPPATLDRAAGHPDPDFGPGPLVDVAAAFRPVWRHLEDRIEEEVREMEEAGKSRLAGNLETVEAYYRQMIEEEKRLLKTRLSRRSREEGEHRLDLLKLEWERRVKEETERLRPQVVASLRAVAVVHSPCERWRRDGDGGGVWVDLGRGEAWRSRNPGA